MIITLLTRCYLVFHEIKYVNLIKLLQEFKQLTWEELDYQQEVANAEYLRKAVASLPLLVIPYTYTQLSTQNIIVQEFITGVPMTEVIKQKAQGQDYRGWLLTHYQTDIQTIIQ